MTGLIAMFISVVLASVFHLFYLMYYHVTPAQLDLPAELGNATDVLGGDEDRGQLVLKYLGASLVIALPAVFGVRSCFRRSNVVALAVQWTHESHETFMTCCGLVPYDARVRSAMIPSFFLGSWIFVSGIWDVPDDQVDELQHPFAAGACAIAAGCCVYGLISLGTGSRLLRQWNEKRVRNVDEDSFFKTWAFREFSSLLLVFFVCNVPAMTLALHHISAGYSAAPVLYILAWAAGPFYVIMPTVVVAITAVNLHRRVLLQFALASDGPVRLETAVRTLTGRWRVVGRDANGQLVTETVVLKCRSVKGKGGEMRIVVDGEHDEREGQESFTLTNGGLFEERGVLKVRFTQQYDTQSMVVDEETGEQVSTLTDRTVSQNEDSSTSWEATLTHCCCNGSDSVPRLHGWWSGEYQGSEFRHRFHASKSIPAASLSSGNAFRDAAHRAAREEAVGLVVANAAALTDQEYASALTAGLGDLHDAEPHTASAMPLINQFRQGAWMSMPLLMVEQVAIASVVHGCPEEVQLHVCVAIVCATLLLAVIKQPYRSATANWSSILARLSNLAFLAVGALIEREMVEPQIGSYLLFGNAGVTCLMLFFSFGPMRMVSSALERCRQIRRGTKETQAYFADDITNAMQDPSALDFWRRERSPEGESMARFHQTVRSCFPHGATLGLHNLQLLDLRALGVLESHTKRALAALLVEVRCERLLVLRMLLVEERAGGVTLDVTTEGNQMPLQNQILGPDDMQVIAGFLCSRVPAEKLAAVDLSHNLVFGRKTFRDRGDDFSAIGSPSTRSVTGYARGGDELVVHTVDRDQAGWLHLSMALQDSPVGSLVLRGIGMGPRGLRTLAGSLVDGLRCLEALDLSENYLRERNDPISLKAFSGFCYGKLTRNPPSQLDLQGCF